MGKANGACKTEKNSKIRGRAIALQRRHRFGGVGLLLSGAAHVVVASPLPVVGLEVRVLCLELERACLGLECTCLLVKRGGLIAIKSISKGGKTNVSHTVPLQAAPLRLLST